MEHWKRIKVARKGDHGGQFAYVMGFDDLELSRGQGYAAIRRVGTGSHIWRWTVSVGVNVTGTRRGSCRTLRDAKAASSECLKELAAK